MCSSDLENQNMIYEQNLDSFTSKIIEKLENGDQVNSYFMDKGILKRNPKSLSHSVTVVPKNLIPFVMALFHFRSHSGSKKLFLEIRNKFWWNRMQDDILDFVRGCVLCNVLKVSNLGKGEIGVPRVVPSPRHTWQIDICQGFPSVNGATSFLNCVDQIGRAHV